MLNRNSLTVVALVLIASSLPAQVQQGTAAAGTLQLTGVPAPAREAFFAAMDAYGSFAFPESFDQANRALAADSTFALAREYRLYTANAATVAAGNAEHARALRDAAGAAPGEVALLAAMRATGVARSRLFATARTFYPNDRRIALEHANSLAGNERVDSLRALARRHPDFVGARLWLAYYLASAPWATSRADLYEALNVAQDAVRLAPRTAGTHVALGHVLMMMGREDEALAHIDAALRMDPRQEYAYVLKSEIYSDDAKPRRVERARAALDSAMAISPNRARRQQQRANRAFFLFYDGRAAEGMAELAAVGRELEDAGQPPAVLYSQMAGLAAGTGDTAGVTKWMTEARRVAGNIDITIQSAQAYALNRQPAEARQAFEEFKRRADTTTLAYRYDVARLSGMILLAEGKPAEALAELKKSDVYANSFAHLALIDAYTALKDQKMANETRAAMLARRDMAANAVSKAILYYRAARPQTAERR